MKVLKLVMVFAAVAGVFCGSPKSGEPGPGTAGKGYGPVPAAAFEVLTQLEVDDLAKVLPDVTAALGAAGYAPEFKEDGGVADIIAASVTGMCAVPGVEDVLKKTGMSREKFETTMFKVMSAAAAAGWDMASAMTEGQEGEEAEMMKAELAKGKEFCAMVPEANKKMVVDNREALGPLAGRP